MTHVNPISAELNPMCHLLALLGAHHILHVSRLRVKVFCLTEIIHLYSIKLFSNNGVIVLDLKFHHKLS